MDPNQLKRLILVSLAKAFISAGACFMPSNKETLLIMLGKRQTALAG
jgi:hypothetical protein